ncbi:threonine synthase [Actinobacillus succinogenes]|uniref:Pyridoxal-5'-phosphate-dependent protein beta subunit n=1 Tax=Actinobacillus succinogenes (strain ATCC 55618 / DSM 22257 / CCUG 43843 / 130Z) TaxID=339671 RepID=A6VNW0_ACTSZ|nr:threonine synthase [Actinobacillus succinogenes]ABR74657.1 Pyridoxal-5'-phosphate-dependent protein beta subunit [Actinobacillus succinogenes 130Z]PHI40920.1 threonine synthase [Actinobacillus succinogenes]
MKFICNQCHQTAPVSTRQAKCQCGGLWTLDYHPPKFDLNDIDRHEWSLFRYRKFIALQDESWRGISLGEGMTPIVRFDDNVLLKMDYFMPTLSFKDRGAAVLISHCKAIGVDSVVQDSSGNAGNSVAAYCAKAGIQCEIFVPEGTSPKKINMIEAHGAKANVIAGSRDHCADVCRAKVENEGIYYANHVYNPFFYEGTKTYIYETFEQLGRIPKHIVVPVGNGTLFIGVIKGLEHLLASGAINEMPTIIALQSEHCDPLLQAVEKGQKFAENVEVKPTIAEGIAIGQPMRAAEILTYAEKYPVRFVHAPEDKILAARDILAKKGVYCEHTTAANYAAYLRYCELYGTAEDCLITMCGAGLKSDH